MSGSQKIFQISIAFLVHFNCAIIIIIVFFLSFLFKRPKVEKSFDIQLVFTYTTKATK